MHTICRALSPRSCVVRAFVDFHDYWRSGGRDIITELCISGYNDISTFAEDKNYYFDHGADQLFSLKNLGHEECSAGIYDIINVDDKLVRKNLMQLTVKKDLAGEDLDALLWGILFHAARMLLVTRGEDAQTEADVYAFFTRHGLVAEAHRPLLALAWQGKTDKLSEYKEQVIAFGEDIAALYKNMDDTMRFPGERENMMVQAAKQQNEIKTSPVGQRIRPNRFKDLSGVQCPLNFAQIKVQLFAMSPGEVLEVILDDGTLIRNVPESVKSEGHTILCQERTGEQWSVLIQKA